MDKHWTRRAVVGAALTAMVPAVVSAQEKAAGKAPAALPTPSASAPAGATTASAKGKLTDQSLGNLLKAMGFETKLEEKQYFFNYKATIEEAEWVLSLSTVLTQDSSAIWIIAWLDELPKSAADVPRTALLRLLAENDRLNKGKFFAYIAGNRRFVMQRVIANENITTSSFNAALEDLGQAVVATHPRWSVANWTSSTGEDPAAAARTGTPVQGSAPQTLPASTQAQPLPARATQSAVNDSKFAPSSKK